MTLKDRLIDGTLKFTSAESRAVRTLLANYPAAGLSTVAGFAERAGVSVPTILRLVSKLGYSGYPAFQQSLIEEVSEKLNSPLLMLDTRSTADAGEHSYAASMRHMAKMLMHAADELAETEFESVLDLLEDPRASIHCIGGRSSGTLAQRLSLILGQIRPHVFHVENVSTRLFDRIADFNSQTTIVVFDYRRYQPDVIRFAQLAHDARARIVLFTDRWLSPISNFADRVLVTPVESLSPFDSRVAGFAQCEAIVGALTRRNPDRVRERLAAVEALRKQGHTHLHKTDPEE